MIPVSDNIITCPDLCWGLFWQRWEVVVAHCCSCICRYYQHYIITLVLVNMVAMILLLTTEHCCSGTLTHFCSLTVTHCCVYLERTRDTCIADWCSLGVVHHAARARGHGGVALLAGLGAALLLHHHGALLQHNTRATWRSHRIVSGVALHSCNVSRVTDLLRQRPVLALLLLYRGALLQHNIAFREYSFTPLATMYLVTLRLGEALVAGVVGELDEVTRPRAVR